MKEHNLELKNEPTRLTPGTWNGQNLWLTSPFLVPTERPLDLSRIKQETCTIGSQTHFDVCLANR